MSAKFESVETEKRQRILTAALREFAEKGYAQASTNRIVQDAGIGKGMLFYYFKSKKELYDYLVEYALNVVSNNYLSQVDRNEPDFLERFKQAGEVKMKSQLENEEVFNFLGTFMLEEGLELPLHLQKKYEELQTTGYELMYGNFDRSLLRDDVDDEKAFKLMRWSIEGYQNELLQKLKGRKMTTINLEPYWKEFYEYLEVLRKTFYK